MSSVTAMSVRIAPLSTAGTSRGTPGRRARISPQTRTGKIARPVARPVRAVDDGGFGAGVATAGTDQTNALDDHVPIDRFYTGLRQLHASPDVFIVDDFITPNQCDSIVAAAKTRAMDQSPVVYAGWTNDVSEVVNIAARGPALWIAALSMLAAASSNGAGPGVLINGAVAYALIVGVAAAGAGTYVKYKESQLRGMRTSTSCALDGASDGERAYVAAAEALMPGSRLLWVSGVGSGLEMPPWKTNIATQQSSEIRWAISAHTSQSERAGRPVTHPQSILPRQLSF